MKNIIKNISLLLVVIMVLTISFGCTPKEKPSEVIPPGNVVDKEDPNDNEDPIKEPEGIIIEATTKVNVSDLSLLDSYIIDFDNNGTDETISLYTAAEKDSNGEIMWDDGQKWKLLVEGTDTDYVLFDDYVQLGSIKFYVYTSDDEFYITTIQTSTASLKLTEYRFHKESNSFISNVKFETSGNVNMLHSSGY